MKQHFLTLIGSFAFSVICFVFAAEARAENFACTPINSIPFNIKYDGSYCLHKNITINMKTGSAITVNTSNVTIDLNGYTLRNTQPGNAATGISAANQNFVRIRNGGIRGFVWGVSLIKGKTSKGNLIEDLRIEGCHYSGIFLHGVEATMVRNNWIANIGPQNTTWGNQGYGVKVVGAKAVSLINNDINYVKADGSGEAYGIYLENSKDVFVEDNKISDTAAGVAYTSGSSGKYRDNITLGVYGLPYSGGVNAGNNK